MQTERGQSLTIVIGFFVVVEMQMLMMSNDVAISEEILTFSFHMKLMTFGSIQLNGMFK